MKRSASVSLTIPESSAKKRKTSTMKRSKSFVFAGPKSTVEIKCYDVFNSGTGISSAGTVEKLNAIASGAEVNQRSGRVISMKSVRSKGWIVAADVTNWVRALWVFDSDPNATSPNVSDVISDLPGNVNVMSPATYNNIGRFRILRDLTFNVGSPGAGNSTGLPIQVPFDVYIPLKKLQAKYVDTTAIAPQQGGLFMVTISDSTIVTHPSIYHSTRLRYYDN